MSAAQINTLVANGNSAIDSEDWASAEKYFMQAKALVASSPDLGKDADSIRWRGMELDKLIDLCRSKQAASSNSSSLGIRRQKIKYVRTSSS